MSEKTDHPITHLAEPWRATDHAIFTVKDHRHITTLARRLSVHEAFATAKRIVLCVNYCAGLPDAKLEGHSALDDQQKIGSDEWKRGYDEARDEFVSISRDDDERL